nr:MAG TPA: hypothetical protein [Caudoviricetes sp.]
MLELDALKTNPLQPHLASPSAPIPILLRGRTMEKQPEPDGVSPINWFPYDPSS